MQPIIFLILRWELKFCKNELWNINKSISAWIAIWKLLKSACVNSVRDLKLKKRYITLF